MLLFNLRWTVPLRHREQPDTHTHIGSDDLHQWLRKDRGWISNVISHKYSKVNAPRACVLVVVCLQSRWSRWTRSGTDSYWKTLWPTNTTDWLQHLRVEERERERKKERMKALKGKEWKQKHTDEKSVGVCPPTETKTSFKLENM